MQRVIHTRDGHQLEVGLCSSDGDRVIELKHRSAYDGTVENIDLTVAQSRALAIELLHINSLFSDLTIRNCLEEVV
jgi:hypothetical protein